MHLVCKLPPQEFANHVDDQKIDPNGQAPAAAGKYHNIASEKRKIRTDAEFHLAYRKKLESAMAARFPMFFRRSAYNKAATECMTESMLKKTGPGNELLKGKFIPKWSPGCRRLIPGEGYLEMLVLDRK